MAYGKEPTQMQSSGTQISLDVDRLKTLLASLNLQNDENHDPLKPTQEALQSGYLYLSLYRLRQLRVQVEPLAYQRAEANVGKQGIAGFEREWQRLGQQLNQGESLLKGNSSAHLPVVVLAMMEISQSQIQPYYKSGRLYGLNTTIENGLYYLGLAGAHLDFATYCKQFKLAQPRPALPLRSLERELKRLESQTVSAFAQAEGTAQQSRYLAVNSALKIAWELNAEKRYGGALLQYLVTCLELNLIKATAFDAEQLPRLNRQSQRLHARLTSAKTDQSIGLLFWEMAQYALEQKDRDKADQVYGNQAAIILDKVLPLYFNYLAGVNR